MSRTTRHSPPLMRRLAPLALLLPAALAAQTVAAPAPAPFQARPLADGPVKVGPAKGTVVVVGGGAMGPEIFRAFIDAAGGPDAVIVDVPNAGGDTVVDRNAGQPWRSAGAKHVAVLFTKDRRIADTDSFTTVIRQAGGVWFEGGRQYHLVQDYGGTQTERAIMDLLDRGGVVGGSSAGASILGDFMVRGAPSTDNTIMDFPGSDRGFGYLRNVGIDQHVVARSRLPDLADSIITRYPTMLGISVDEGTAWIIRGDTGRIVGRSKAFVYNGTAHDDGAPFLTLYPGDRYDLAARRVIERAADRSPVTSGLIASLLGRYDDPALGGATVLVARDGEVLVDRAFGIGAQARYLPRTTVPQFPIGDIARAFTELCAQLPPPSRAATAQDSTRGVTATRRSSGPPPSLLQRCVTQLSAPVGMHRTVADSAEIRSSVDELYRMALGLDAAPAWRGLDATKGWTSDRYKGTTRLASYATADGKRGAFVRLPEQHATVIILTNDANADARGMSQRVVDQLLAAPH